MITTLTLGEDGRRRAARPACPRLDSAPAGAVLPSFGAGAPVDGPRNGEIGLD